MVAAVIQPSISLVSQCVAIIRQKPVARQILHVTSRQKSSTPSGGPLRGGLGYRSPCSVAGVAKRCRTFVLYGQGACDVCPGFPEAKGREAVTTRLRTP